MAYRRELVEGPGGPFPHPTILLCLSDPGCGAQTESRGMQILNIICGQRRTAVPPHFVILNFLIFPLGVGSVVDRAPAQSFTNFMRQHFVRPESYVSM